MVQSFDLAGLRHHAAILQASQWKIISYVYAAGLVQCELYERHCEIMSAAQHMLSCTGCSPSVPKCYIDSLVICNLPSGHNQSSASDHQAFDKYLAYAGCHLNRSHLQYGTAQLQCCCCKEAPS